MRTFAVLLLGLASLSLAFELPESCMSEVQELCSESTLQEAASCLQENLGTLSSRCLRLAAVHSLCSDQINSECSGTENFRQMLTCLTESTEKSEACTLALADPLKHMEQVFASRLGESKIHLAKCSTEMQKYCPNIPEDNFKEVAQCLYEHKPDLSESCGAQLFSGSFEFVAGGKGKMDEKRREVPHHKEEGRDPSSNADHKKKRHSEERVRKRVGGATLPSSVLHEDFSGHKMHRKGGNHANNINNPEENRQLQGYLDSNKISTKLVPHEHIFRSNKNLRTTDSSNSKFKVVDIGKEKAKQS